MTSVSDLRRRFQEECGGRFFLDPSEPRAIEKHLRELGWFGDDRVLSAEKIGDGNMNLTLRVRMERHCIIIKQSRPWVEKYPSISAPAHRSTTEAAFYTAVVSEPAVSGRMPALLGSDPQSYLLILEDVPDASDLTTLYAGDRLSSADLDELAEYLNALHAIEIDEDERRVFRNRDMRALNHAHQFEIPLRPGNGAALGAELVRDRTYCARVEELGRLYLADGPTLLHGDFFPGSWLRTPLGLSIIDPEFCFAGCREYDLGILTAHLLFTAHDDLLTGLRARYGSAADWTLVDAFAGVELMRRLIGVAQLPLAAGLDQKRAWLEQSRRLVCG